jgi:uncharacterized protein (UPF0210 family)
LKKRESSRQIVAIIEGDQTKVRYSNRVAMHIMSSPDMKQLDYETVMDVQNQQDRLAKQKMKDVVLQEIARQTGTPYVQLRAQHDPNRMTPAVQQARSVSDYQEALEDRMSDYRAEVGEMLNAQTQTETSRKFEMADLVAQQLKWRELSSRRRRHDSGEGDPSGYGHGEQADADTVATGGGGAQETNG